MSASGFDRLRPRAPRAEQVTPMQHDSEGKRALFSATETTRPLAGGIVVDCSRCANQTTLTPAAALRVMFPALHLSVGVRHGDSETTIGLLRRRGPGSWLRCPSCGRLAWARVTVRI